MTKEVISPQHTDAVLVAMFRKNKSYAIELIYKKYWNQLVHYANIYLRDRDSAEEMVQKLFVNIFVKDISFNKDLHLAAYLHRSVKNEVSNHMRKQSLYQRHIFRSSQANNVSKDYIQNMMESFDVKANIYKAVDAIPEKIRVVYLLNREEQMTIKEISKKLKRPEDTIDKQLRRAVYFLRTRLNCLAV